MIIEGFFLIKGRVILPSDSQSTSLKGSISILKIRFIYPLLL